MLDNPGYKLLSGMAQEMQDQLSAIKDVTGTPGFKLVDQMLLKQAEGASDLAVETVSFFFPAPHASPLV